MDYLCGMEHDRNRKYFAIVKLAYFLRGLGFLVLIGGLAAAAAFGISLIALLVGIGSGGLSLLCIGAGQVLLLLVDIGRDIKRIADASERYGR